MITFKNHISLTLFSLLSVFSLLTQSQTTPLPLYAVGPGGNGGGRWAVLQKSIGVSAMHMQLLRNNKVVIFDRTDFGTSNLSLPTGKSCRRNDAVVKLDCSAHSVLYDFASNTYRPLTVQTDVWCSSGAVHPDGTLVQTGGYNSGDRKIRLFTPSTTNYAAVDGGDGDDSDWVELPADLKVRRWYATNHILPDGRVIVVGGRKQFNYEFFPQNTPPKIFSLPFLNSTRDRFEENNLYPFLHLLPDGTLFIFANRRSISFDFTKNRVVREFPAIPGEKRNYPSTGSSVLLPLRGREAEVMICGGAPNFAFYKSEKFRIFVEGSRTCGRLRVSDFNSKWVMERMPMSRVMSDMILLPTGDVLIINGASSGTAGWEDAVGPVLNPILYYPTEPDPSKRFQVMNPSAIPRLYHSSAILLPDGRILVGGSNPHVKYNFTAFYRTELSLEAFSPPYMGPEYSYLRPKIVSVEAMDNMILYGQKFSIKFVVACDPLYREITVALIAPSFTTHSFGMNQRLVYLDVVGGVQQVTAFGYKVNVVAPPTKNVAPPGYYMLFVVHGGIPGGCSWIKIEN
ncbi:aldehyde oxidase GLOX-like [Rhododendron vialii]|uniref:aldehyde oxidase GLOX-like n=1 Tax=Rhododendron vialii TaxID=182163 RepID=UPI00265D9503|nr:aldehyde oxidase GLOX-like [Rhododendron vialii]